jgi:hypothetical protein
MRRVEIHHPVFFPGLTAASPAYMARRPRENPPFSDLMTERRALSKRIGPTAFNPPAQRKLRGVGQPGLGQETVTSYDAGDIWGTAGRAGH